MLVDVCIPYVNTAKYLGIMLDVELGRLGEAQTWPYIANYSYTNKLLSRYDHIVRNYGVKRYC